MKYVLDTNAAVAAMNGVAPVLSRLSQLDVAEIGIPIVAVAELTYGAHVSQRRDENLATIAKLRRLVATLPLTDEIVSRYGATRAQLRVRGVAKSDFDLLIACTTLEAGATLVTDDGALLDGTIPDLRAENWMRP